MPRPIIIQEDKPQMNSGGDLSPLGWVVIIVIITMCYLLKK